MYPDDSRSSRRSPVRGRFQGASRTAIRGDLRDLSPTGLCLSTTTAMERGQVLHLEFELPTGPVELVAEVRWATPRQDGTYESGLRIVRIPEPSLNAIREATTHRRASARLQRAAS
ncbi:MAG: PilZ domain-containing protein [Myxococcota bacterium]|jgi:hypothetical protein